MAKQRTQRRRRWEAYCPMGREVMPVPAPPLHDIPLLPEDRLPAQGAVRVASVPERPGYDALTRVTHRQFVDEYLVDGNAARAARAAGFSERNARNYGGELLRRPNIQAAIHERLAELTLNAGDLITRVRTRLEAIAFMPVASMWRADTKRIRVIMEALDKLMKLEERLSRYNGLASLENQYPDLIGLSEEELDRIALAGRAADGEPAQGATEPHPVRQRD
jgi:Terminase small subunit